MENGIELFIEKGRQKYNTLKSFIDLFQDESNFVNLPGSNDWTEGDIGRFKSIMRASKQLRFETAAERNAFNTNKGMDFFAVSFFDVSAGFSPSANKFNERTRTKKIRSGKVFISISNLDTTAVAWKNKQRI